MCGRYAVFTSEEYREMQEILREVNERSKERVKTGEIFPTDLAPVLLKEDNRLVPYPMTWGFPRYKAKGVVFNARIETVAEKSMFRDSLFERRCIVPTTGFYEWKLEDGHKKKTKYIFEEPESNIVYLAGIYKTFRSEDGAQEPRFTILTTDANASVAPTHTRMPVVLTGGDTELWLADPLYLPHFVDRSQVVLSREAVS